MAIQAKDQLITGRWATSNACAEKQLGSHLLSIISRGTGQKNSWQQVTIIFKKPRKLTGEIRESQRHRWMERRHHGMTKHSDSIAGSHQHVSLTTQILCYLNTSIAQGWIDRILVSEMQSYGDWVLWNRFS